MKTNTSLLTIISVVAVAAAAFVSFKGEKLGADSDGSLAATAETFPSSFKENAPATAPFALSNAKAGVVTDSFPLSDAETGAMAAAFLPWLFLLRLKRYLARHRNCKRNHPIPHRRRLECSVFAGMNAAKRIQRAIRTLTQSLTGLGKSTGIGIVVTFMLVGTIDSNAAQPSPEILFFGEDTIEKFQFRVDKDWLLVIKGHWEKEEFKNRVCYQPGSRKREEELGTYHYYYGESCAEIYGYYARKKQTLHYVDDGKDPEYNNIYDKDEDSNGEVISNWLSEDDDSDPVVPWEGKDTFVGEHVVYNHPWWTLGLHPDYGSTKTVYKSSTSVMEVTKHRSGRHRFAVYIDYEIEGDPTNTIMHDYSIFLNPGEVWVKTLSTSRGKWANVSVSARHSGKRRKGGISKGTGVGSANSSVYLYWQIGVRGPDVGIGGSLPIQSQSTNNVSSIDTSNN